MEVIPLSQSEEIEDGLRTPPVSDLNFWGQPSSCDPSLAAQFTAAQPTAHGGDQSTVSPFAHTRASTSQFVKRPASPSVQSTAASQSRIGEPREGKSPTRSAFSTTYQSLAQEQDFVSRLSGYKKDVARQSAVTSNAK